MTEEPNVIYSFNNQYVGGIQAGIQAAHMIAKMKEVVGDEIIICLNAGDDENLMKILEFFQMDDNPYNHSFFEEPGLRDALTSVGILVPSRIFEAARAIRKNRKCFFRFNRLVVEIDRVSMADFNPDWMVFSDFDIALVGQINQYGLMR